MLLIEVQRTNTTETRDTTIRTTTRTSGKTAQDGALSTPRTRLVACKHTFYRPLFSLVSKSYDKTSCHATMYNPHSLEHQRFGWVVEKDWIIIRRATLESSKYLKACKTLSKRQSEGLPFELSIRPFPCNKEKRLCTWRWI